MKHFSVPLLLAAVTCSSVTPEARSQEALAEKIRAIMDGPDYKQAHWGLLIVDAASGKRVYERDPDRLFIPASTTKLFSCAAALAEFGPDYRFETPVYRRGEVREGVLRGDLILVASGDLTFGGRLSKDGKVLFADHDHIYANSDTTESAVTDSNPTQALDELAKQILASGIREVRGEVLIDDRLFDPARGSGSGPDTLSPMIVNDNVVDVIITPGAKEGESAQCHMRPETAAVQMDADVVTVAKGQARHLEVRTAGGQRFSVHGQIPIDDRPQVRIYPVDSPTLFARTLFIEALRRQGVKVHANLFHADRTALPAPKEYAEANRVANFTSPPFAGAIKVTLKVSHNLYASTLPLLIAARHGERTLANGLRRQGKILSELGVPVETISFGGGAGGAAADAITPRAAVQLLTAMHKRPDGHAYFDALPVLGMDGTLADVVGKESPARGKVSAKTGTLFWSDLMNDRPLLTSKALAGTMETAKGTRLYLALFVNDVPLPKGTTPLREGKVLGKVCEVIYEYGP
jgi:D-alanyl-D-alanine carboxypeptidase/D-alanyl-D-alanine-endopeptidase (penicillin-binding protein 4)